MKRIIASDTGEMFTTTIDGISAILNSESRHRLSNYLWITVADKPVVKFSIAHDGKNIFLKYFVTEKFCRAVETEINGRIWEDSCVEFFISFDDGVTYYNLEFNSNGIGLIGFGQNRNSRELLPKQVVQKVKVMTGMRDADDRKEWELTLVIPTDIFIHHRIERLHGKSCKANFYKCGDLTPTPHFISWNKVLSTEPDFHLPEFFGEIRFEWLHDILN